MLAFTDHFAYNMFMDHKDNMENKKLIMDQFLVLIITTLFLVLVSGIIQTPFYRIGGSFAETDPDLVPLFDYASTLGVWIVFLLFMLIYKPDRPLIPAIFRGPANKPAWFFGGLAIGFVANASCVLVSVLHKDISLYFSPSKVLYLVLAFFAVLVQSGSEELVCRHFMQQHLRRRYHNPWLEILLPGLFFASLHLMNPGLTATAVISLVLCGILLGACIYFFDSLWLVIGFHTMWNFTQNVLFGLPNSGIVTPLSIFRLDAASATDSFSYSADFGVEGSPMALLILSVLLVLTILFGIKKRRSPAG